MTTRVLILGAGFGGLQLSARLSDEGNGAFDVVLIDRTDAFVFGFSKLDMMFRGSSPDTIRTPYADLTKPGVRFLQETITQIDPEARRVTTDRGTYEADVLVVALGADLDIAATPGLATHGYEFYSEAGAERARDALGAFERGEVVVGACGPGFKCPPAPSETALLTDELLRSRGVRPDAGITLVLPFGRPVPPSPETSDAILGRFAERNIRFVAERRIAALDGEQRRASLDDGSQIACDLLLAIPVHRAPDVVLASPLAEDGWIPVDRDTLATRFPNVYAVGDVTSVGTAKAGVFAEGAADVVAERLLADERGGPEPDPYTGAATCYVELGREEVAKVDVDFLSGPSVTAVFGEPSPQIRAEKASFAPTRRGRWFG